MSQSPVSEDAQRTLAGRYTIQELIGRGGMASVYRGTDTKLGRQVAIKIMRANLAEDTQFRARFRHEAQSASRLTHPGVVRVLDAGDDLFQSPNGPQQLPFIVMEYVDGKNLHELTAGKQVTTAGACRIVSSVLTALEYSHRAGIVHRDIKPANIMVTRSGQIKVMDFGIARAVSETSATVQQTTAVLGTAAYFSPEQAKGETVDIRTDLYSVGVLLYELLAGVTPFTGDTAVAVAYQHVSEPPLPPSTHRAEISASLDRVVLHALAKDRGRRFQTAAEFREALQLAERGVTPKLTHDSGQDTLFFEGTEELSESERALQRLADTGASLRSQSRPPVMWVWAAILTVVAVLVAVGFWVLTMIPNTFMPETSREVPDLIGFEREAAIDVLTGLGMQTIVEEIFADDVREGEIVGTDPEAGARLPVGAKITLFVSLGAEHPTVPAFDRMSLQEYTAAVEAAGLMIGSVTHQDSTTEPADRVTAVSPGPGTPLDRGSAIDVTVSSGLVTIPDVTGQALEAALLMLEGVANATPLPQADCLREPGFPIIEQSLIGRQPQGSLVDLRYCSG